MLLKLNLTLEQVLAEVEAWVAEAENGDNDSDLALAKFYRTISARRPNSLAKLDG